MKKMDYLEWMQCIVFGLMVLAFFATFIGQTVLALANQRWGTAVVMAVIVISGAGVIRSAVEEMKKD